jgi:hypothetical protein
MLRILITLVLGYVIALLILRIFESAFIFFPNYPGRLEGNWHPHNLPIQDVWLTSSDGTKLHAWWIPQDQAHFTFLAFHGNAGNMAGRAPVYAFLRDTPANVFALEYRGYGKSEGAPSEDGLYRDADASLHYLTNNLRINPKQIVVFGQSLGTAVASHLAANNDVGGVVLEAPIPSASLMARRVFWFLPGMSLMVTGQLNTIGNVRRTNAPKFIVHCTEDPVIPADLEDRVYQAANPPKTILRIQGSCHEEASLISPTRYRAALQEFLKTLDTQGMQP